MNKNSIVISFFCALLMGLIYSLPACAQAGEKAGPGVHLTVLRIAFMHTHYNRVEPQSKPYLETETGSLPGGAVEFEWFSNRVYLDAGVLVGDGSVDYDGSLQQGTPYKAKDRVLAVDGHIRGGPAFYTGTEQNIIVPYLGLDNRFAHDDGDVNGAHGYTTEREMLFLTFGLSDRVAVTEKLQVEARLGGNYGLYGEVSPFGSGTYHNDGLGLDAALSLDYRIWNAVGVFARLAFRQLRYGKALLDYPYYEPESRIYEQHYLVGISIGQF